jgi:hypothetical protein
MAHHSKGFSDLGVGWFHQYLSSKKSSMDAKTLLAHLTAPSKSVDWCRRGL